MICISILCFGHIANKFNVVLSILKEVIIFPEKGDLFVLAIYIPARGREMLFIYRGFLAKDRVPVGTRSVAKSRGK